ncbi:MAG: ATP-dependent metallopeptidase FtsH/Yme1/Tma family protein [Candidatus Marinimicrobia bacterium]|nr:ATP-dependent metallopeptidase FtsH/Yme1/Tma family protein [Pelagibacterales bacterium]MBT3944739.1 ATP-dependent metallopeptidase FtsH/Yme1/Tma family protein [Candidatus Neomarinimicrobiota bacterium]MBT4707081.1 ATP-dependent metallopeptidase FtsH/Yme1/Tma family protein [Candidatus Neomarinimicrobiota bacterium]MBT5251695.1 ATP-dependent metallopeptidase FtsH/Yme1/Tma family protein [Candidatus Neomarinimicrobiota bacterium]MBT6840193.1 ATP-dependent metallopeptidase FtsH/Yme1/Tma famil
MSLSLLPNESANEVEISYNTYKELLSDNKIKEASIENDNSFHGELLVPATLINKNGAEFTERTFFVVYLPSDYTDQIKIWDEKSIEYNFEGDKIDWTRTLIGFAPWLLLIAFWIFMIRRMQGSNSGMNNVFSFGKSKAKMFSANQKKVKFGDVAGCIEAKEELEEVIAYLKNPKKFEKLGGKIPRGVLLVGPPGTGKTLLARAVAGESNVPFFSISGADFVEMFVGVGASRVRDLFEQANKTAPAIIFIDELDAVGRQRGAGLGGGHDEREQTLNQLLVELDGFENNSSVIVMAATNRPDVLDSALLRPGRFDRQVVVDVPDLQGRHDILKIHTKKIKMNKKSVKLKDIAKGTPGMVGADLANLVNEAALLASRKRKASVDNNDFEEAKDKVIMGVQRKSMILSDDEKKVTAYHEAGHAVVAIFAPEADPVHKVTIIPRGRALGVTMQLPLDEKHGYSKTYILSRLAVMMGGRSAEELIFNEITTGASNDIERATSIARKMVCEWGMSDELGPMSFGKKNEEIFLGREIQSHRDYSEQTAQKIDHEVVSIIKNAQKVSHKILKDNIDLLNLMAQQLLEHETIDENDIKLLVAGKKLSKKINK